MAVEIRLVTSAEDRLAVQRQRYDIFIEELGYAGAHADPKARTIADPLDAHGHILAAFVGSKIVASVRINQGEFGEYAELPCVRRFAPYFPDRMMLITKLVIDREHRAGTLMGRMSAAIYVHTLHQAPRVLFGVMSCVPVHKGFFHRFGYRQIGPTFEHSAAGTTLPMVAAMYDKERFRQLNCSLFEMCPRHDAESADWFAQTFADEFEADACASL